MEKLKIGCIADDFTGASDIASFFQKGGLKTTLFTGIPSETDTAIVNDAQAVVIALKCRTTPSSEAVRDVLTAAAWLKAAGAEKLYYKYCSTFDSSPEGNIGPISDAMLDWLGTPYTILCPSLPANGRLVKDGRLYVNGVPLDESPMKNHPITPMWDSRLKVLMESQSRYPVFELTAEEMKKGPGYVHTLMERYSAAHAHFYIVPEYYEDGHGELIESCFRELPFYTGGSGLAVALGKQAVSENVNAASGISSEAKIPHEVPAQRIPAHTEEAQEAAQGTAVNVEAAQGMLIEAKAAQAAVEKEAGRTAAHKAPGSAILIAGSCSAMTQKQVSTFKEEGGSSFFIDPEKLLSGEITKEQILKHMEAHKEEPVLYYSSDNAENVRRAQTHGMEMVSGMLEQTMAELAFKAAEQGITRIIVAGGETSGAVTQKLGFSAFRVGASIAPGVPVLTPYSREDVRLVLKSGNFGDEHFFKKALELTAD